MQPINRLFIVAATLLIISCSGMERAEPRLPVSGTALGIDADGEITRNAGAWSASINTPATSLRGGQVLPVTTVLQVEDGVLAALRKRNGKLDKIVMLLTAERVFDADGRQHRGSDDGMSTILTPSGIPIQGGSQGAITPRFYNYPFRTPVDELVELPLPATLDGRQTFRFQVNAKVMDALPPGLYRLRASFF